MDHPSPPAEHASTTAGPTPASREPAPDHDAPTRDPVRTVRTVRRSRRDRVVGGVCGGLGEYLGIDPVLLRIAAVALTLSAGVGVLAYVIAWIVIPEAGDDDPPPRPPRGDRHAVAVVAGAALVALGVLLLFRAIVPWFDGVVFWPLVVIAAGVVIVLSSRR